MLPSFFLPCGWTGLGLVQSRSSHSIIQYFTVFLHMPNPMKSQRHSHGQSHSTKIIVTSPAVPFLSTTLVPSIQQKAIDNGTRRRPGLHHCRPDRLQCPRHSYQGAAGLDSVSCMPRLTWGRSLTARSSQHCFKRSALKGSVYV